MTHRLHLSVYVLLIELAISLPVRASEQGNVIWFVHIHIYMCVCTKKIVIERTRDLILHQICSDRLLTENN